MSRKENETNHSTKPSDQQICFAPYCKVQQGCNSLTIFLEEFLHFLEFLFGLAVEFARFVDDFLEARNDRSCGGGPASVEGEAVGGVESSRVVGFRRFVAVRL